MGQVTLDYTVPLAVTVDTDSGEVLRVVLCGESFQEADTQPARVFAGSSAEYERGEVDEYLERTHPLAQQALALGSRVQLEPSELLLPFALSDEASDTSGLAGYGAVVGDAGADALASLKAANDAAERAYWAALPAFEKRRSEEREISRLAQTPLVPAHRSRTSPLAE